MGTQPAVRGHAVQGLVTSQGISRGCQALGAELADARLKAA